MPSQDWSAPRGVGHAAATEGWLCPTTLASLAELNEMALALLAEQAAARSPAAPPLLRVVAESWQALDAHARRRAAACPYLLLDAGFADYQRWQAACSAQVGDTGEGAYGVFFTVPAVARVARLVFVYAWHLSRSQSAAAQLLLGATAATTLAIARHTLPQIQALAERCPGWLAPRWPSRVKVWRELLLAAGSGDPAEVERAHLRGITLLAAEARAAPGRAERLGITG
jgi:hypothetical protein